MGGIGNGDVPVKDSKKTQKTIKKISALGLVGIIATTLIYMADLVYYPAFAAMMQAFPEASINVMNFCMTGSQLSAMVAAFAVMPLMRVIDKKTLLLIETAIFGICAICAPLVPDAMFVTVMRTLSGFGFGGMLAVSAALIQQVYRDNKATRDRLIGMYNSMLGFAGIINSAVGGVLAVISWDAIFKYYWIAVPIFLLILFFVPRTPTDRADEKAEKAEKSVAVGADAAATKGGVGWGGKLPRIILVTLAYMFVNIIFVAVASGEVSVYVLELGLGAEAEAGILLTLANVASFLAGLVFPWMFHRTGRFLPVVLYGAIVVGLALYCMPSSLALLIAGIMLCTFAYAGALSYYMVYASESVPADKASSAISLVTVGMCFGAFISPYVVTWIRMALGVSTLAPVYPVLLVCGVAALVASIATAVRSRKLGERFGQAEPAADVEG